MLSFSLCHSSKQEESIHSSHATSIIPDPDPTGGETVGKQQHNMRLSWTKVRKHGKRASVSVGNVFVDSSLAVLVTQKAFLAVIVAFDAQNYYYVA